MTDVLVAPQPATGRQRLVGRVWANIVIANRGDVVLAERGILPREAIRTVSLDHVLVDTGATNLCLPPEIIAALGLPLLEEVAVETATGVVTARLYQDATVTVEGRTRTFDCLELPGGTQPLLGVVPLQALGINLDLANERMTLLPDRGEGTYLSIL
jgi:clan AA aspartic protease